MPSKRLCAKTSAQSLFHFARRHSDYLALICIHRFINFSDKGFPALLFIRKDLIPHRKGQPVGPPAILIKLPRAGRDAFGHQTDFSLISNREQDNKFVAGKSDQDIVFSRCSPQDLTCIRDGLISDKMAAAIIDGFESVNIQHNARAVFSTLGFLEQLVDIPIEILSVE